MSKQPFEAKAEYFRAELKKIRAQLATAEKALLGMARVQDSQAWAWREEAMLLEAFLRAEGYERHETERKWVKENK